MIDVFGNELYPHETCIERYLICINIDECYIGTDLCPVEYHCYDRTPFFKCCNYRYGGNYHCTCPPKFTMLNNNSGCFNLLCDDGWEFSEDEFYCVDIDECSTQRHACSADTFCHNNHGAYTCEPCDVGFEPFVPEGSGQEGDPEPGSCVDIDECFLDPDICQFGICVNTVGSYTCDCHPGYIITLPPDSRRCQTIEHNGEHEHEYCDYNPICLDLDECATGSDLCPTDLYCGNQDPFFHCCDRNNGNCQCPTGFVRRNSASQCLPIFCQLGFELDTDGQGW